MRNRMAILDLKTVRQAYEQNDFQAAGAIKKLYTKGVMIVLVSNGRRSKQIDAWLKEKQLNQHNVIFKTEAAKNKFMSLFLYLIPVNWKQFFVHNLLESMKAGEAPPVERIFFADSNARNRKAVTKLKDKRVIICDSLVAAAGKVF